MNISIQPICEKDHNILEKLLSIQFSKRTEFLFIFLAILVFTSLPIYKALRQPRIGDADIVRIGLLVLNRYSSESFPQDAAMQAGNWWPGYTPWYLFMLGLGYRTIGDLGIIFGIITAIDYIGLMIGFYYLGRKFGLPVILSLSLSYMSGLYQITGHALAWAGVGNEMATPRNIYLALFPWILLIFIRLYQTAPNKYRYWFIWGGVLGLSTIIHSVSAGLTLSIFATMMLIGVIFNRFDWRSLIAFLIGALPSTYVGYQTVGSILEVSSVVPDTSALPFIYFSVARANVFFYRLPDWSLSIGVFTVLMLLIGGILARSYRQNRSIPQTIWILFGLLQFAALVLVLLVDWWILLVAIEWVRRVRLGKLSPYERLTIVYLAAVNFITLSLCAGLSILGNGSGAFTLVAIARLFQRGQPLTYAGLIILSCFILWDHLRTYPSRLLFLITSLATAITGLHMAEFETIPGRWLPFDYWIYLGVAILIFWPRLNHVNLKKVRNAGVTMIFIQAVSRILAFPAPSSITFLIGVIVILANLILERASLPNPTKFAVKVAALLVVLGILVLPASGTSFLSEVLVNTRKVVLRDWSRLDTQSYYSIFYPIGNWLRENTPPDSLILTDLTELRYWSFRSQTVSGGDPTFLQNYPDLYGIYQKELERVREAFTSPDKLIAYGRAIGADYFIIDKTTTPFTFNSTQVTEMFDGDRLIIYQLKQG